jgi:hypothetical protein
LNLVIAEFLYSSARAVVSPRYWRVPEAVPKVV